MDFHTIFLWLDLVPGNFKNVKWPTDKKTKINLFEFLLFREKYQ